MLATLPLASTRFVAISKSGGTAETLMQTIAALTAIKDAGLAARIPHCFSDSPNRRRAANQTACDRC